MGINKILEKHNLINVFETELNVQKETFINEFKSITEKSYYSPFLIMFDLNKSEEKKYLGNISSSSFRIREKFKIPKGFTLKYSNAENFASVKSDFFVENKKLKVKTKIQGMEAFPFILRVLISTLYLLVMLVFFIEILFSQSLNEIEIEDILPAIFITLIVMFLTYIPYKRAKKNVEKKKKEIELIYDKIEKTPYNKV